MSERGVFAVDRGLWEHPSFACEPFTEREAWQWLFGEAAYKSHRRRIGSATIDLQRGQVAASLRFMAEKWQWSEPRVRRFLKRLKTDAMIDAATDAGVTVITICNYNKWQRVSLPSDAATDAQSDARATQQRRKGEYKEYKEYKEVNGAPSAPFIGQPTEEAELYSRGKRILGKNSGGLIAKLLKSKNGNVALARASIEQASTKQNPSEYIARIVHGPTGGKVDLADQQDVMRFILS